MLIGNKTHKTISLMKKNQFTNAYRNPWMGNWLNYVLGAKVLVSFRNACRHLGFFFNQEKEKRRITFFLIRGDQ